MSEIRPEEIRRIVRQILNELGFVVSAGSKGHRAGSPVKGPRTLLVFHAGVRKLEEALKQSRLIEESSSKSSVFSAASARAWICGEDIREKAGTRCILDTVKSEGLEKVLARADVLVLPTFCLRVAAKVAHFTCDDQDSWIVFSALVQGKKILASRDGFLLWDGLRNERVRQGIEKILRQLQGFGVVFSNTDQLYEMFRNMMTSPDDDAAGKVQSNNMGTRPRLVTARHVMEAVGSKRDSIKTVPMGIVTALARDLAKEYGVEIVDT